MKHRGMLMVVCLGLFACSDSAPARLVSIEAPAAAPASTSAPAGGPETRGAPAASIEQRKVIRSANLTLASKQPREVLRRATQIAAKYGGFVAGSEATADGGALRSVELSLRVPSGTFEAAVAEISGLGALQHQAISGQDVTEEFVDVEARAQSKRVLQARLREIAHDAGSLSDVLTLEREISRVEGELDSIDGRMRFLTSHSDLASIQLTATVPEFSKPVDPTFWQRIKEAAGRGSEGFTGVAEGLIVMTMSVVPMLPFAALIWLVVRAIRRGRRERAAA